MFSFREACHQVSCSAYHQEEHQASETEDFASRSHCISSVLTENGGPLREHVKLLG